jgi:hypothetical protein
MVQAAEPRQADHCAIASSVHCPPTTCRSRLLQSKMRSVVMIVADVFSYEAFQMPFIEDDDMIEQFPAATAGYPGPVALEPCAMPTDDSLRLDEDQSVFPTRP